jgi:hypothetical protein
VATGFSVDDVSAINLAGAKIRQTYQIIEAVFKEGYGDFSMVSSFVALISLQLRRTLVLYQFYSAIRFT